MDLESKMLEKMPNESCDSHISLIIKGLVSFLFFSLFAQ